ncbi:MAG: DUF1311 domain-containing protein [Gammaproteobacteria bacterium]|nr:DUF1311 domain-containing protein [Gammaproteobacteria bacterium]MBU2179085.1 DUF1311 domain-containing protein [Gammaproteobacteria bacterium]MBU2225148.1 DUF1311 domain-containing protein [Gammaproteobacteria bacterium]MBU2425892.1 DUF1311 domain-containing protein [Gammaproteobacteria bacterium]
MKIVIYLCALLGSFQLLAASACSGKNLSQLDYSRCLDAELEQAERELVTWENGHLFQLQEMAEKTGRDDPLKVFIRSRNQFKQFRNDHCRWQYLALIPDSQAGASVFKECMIDQLKSQSLLLSKIKY